MKKIILITASILIFASYSFAANGFKEGNKLYLNGKYQDALNQYQEFTQKNPDYYEGFFNAGNAFFRQEQYDNALGMYKKAQELNPKDPDVQYNIEVTQKKMEQKKKENENPSQDKNGQNKKDSKNQQGKNNKQNQQQQGKNGQQQGQKSDSAKASSDKQQGQQAKAGNQESKQPPSGMTEDEVQALLNQKQNQEKQLQGYFGKQYQKQNQEQDMFNMSPQEMMMYMQRKMADPNYEPPQKQGGGGNEKDW